jgi:hypothetical protein
MSRVSSLIASISLLALTACMGTTECSCVAPSTGLTVSGTVSLTGAPLTNAYVRVNVAPGLCEAAASPIASEVGGAETGVSGTYEARLGTTQTGPTCVIVTATKFDPGEISGTRRIDVSLPTALTGETREIRADVATAAR